MNLGHTICVIIFHYFLNHWPFFVVLTFMGVFCSQWYENYFRDNRNTDHIDLMERYLWLTMRKKYGRPQV